MTELISHLVFDLGGVIVKLRGTPIPLEWFPDNDKPDDIWQRWLTSEAPRLFESGKIGKDEFSERVVEDLSLRCSPAEFLQYFSRLPECVFEGAKLLLTQARAQYTTACFSNSNELHWEGKLYDMDLASHFDHHFASHLMGVVKPDAHGFNQVINTLSVDASHILFFDDNLMNVTAARSAGMQARHVVGITELTAALKELGVG